MANTVSSNSFLLTTTPHSRLLLSSKPRHLTVFAKNSGPFSSFRLRKSSDNDEDDDDPQQVKPNSPFQFNWGNVKMSEVDVKSLIPVVTNPSGLVMAPGRQKDPATVFVAGATGQAGARIAQQLLREGFKVRAGVPDLGAAQELARFASEYKIISKEELKRLNAVESMFDDAESIAKAIGNASKVVVTIGSLENGPDKEVSPSDALQVVEAAQLAGVGHMAIIYDESPVASTYNVLDGISSFFNNLFSRSQPLTVPEFLEKVIQTDVRYTFIRTALTEDFSDESSYNVVVAAEGSAGIDDFKVARSQMAALVAGLFSNTEVAEDKVVDVYTDPSATWKALEELFSAIPVDSRRQEYAEAVARAKAEEAAMKAAEQARDAAEATRKLEDEVKRLAEQEALATSLAEDAKEKADKAGASLDSLLTKTKALGSEGLLSWKKLGSQLSNAVQTSNIDIPNVQVATVRGQAKARNLSAQKAVTKQSTPKPKSRPKPEPEPEEETPKDKDAKTEVRNIFGGMFKQETIYVEDDI